MNILTTSATYRKSILIFCSVAFGILFFHLIGGYLYADGKYVGLPGGSISIGMVGDAPNVMNPLQYGSG